MGLDMYLSRIDRRVVGFKDFDLARLKEENPQQYSELKSFIFQHGSAAFHWESLSEDVGYWRKANQIHRWFVENVQKGVDNCEEHEVSKEQLTQLLNICIEVLNSTVMIQSKVRNGYTFDENGKKKYFYDDGKQILNPSVARSLLPAQEGFFFGSTDYDEYYVSDVSDTVDILQKVLAETNFDTHAIYYCSSW